MKRSRKETVDLWSKFLLRAARGGLHRVDPRVVRFKKPRRFPKWVMTIQVVVVLLAVGVAATAAVLPGKETRPASKGPLVEVEKSYGSSKIDPPTEEIKPPKPDEPISHLPEPVRKDSEFYDPLYVFLDAEVEKVTAYPLASPPGIVVDLMGTPEPNLEADKYVGKDERIRKMRRRVTSTGIRYIIGLTTPIKRIETVKEGYVVMVFPKS